MSKVLEKLNIQLKSSNFDFMKLDDDLAGLYKTAVQAEIDFALEAYDNTVVNVGKVAEALTDLVIDLNYGTVPYRATWNDRLMQMKKYSIPKGVVDTFYDIKKSRNQGAHDVKEDINLAYRALQQLRIILRWYMQRFSDVQMQQTTFIQPMVVNRFKNNQERKLIYIQTADNSSGLWPAYEGAEKIGETTAPEEDLEEDWSPNSEFLRSATRRRLNGYMKTAGVPAQIDWSELAWIKMTKSWFGDIDVHEVLRRSGYKNQEGLEGAEWFHIDLETAKAAIKAVKDGRKSLKAESDKKTSQIVLRKEQEDAVKQATKAFKKNNKVLWNAKMRFGKTISTYELIKENNYQNVLVMTHRPVVSDSWFGDFKRMKMAELGYEYASKDKGEDNLGKLLKKESKFIYFVSIQDLRGSIDVGGKFQKNSEFFQADWDLIVVDEAHEGTQTERGDKLYDGLTKENTKVLELSGTPFNIIDEFSEEQVFTWDYIMEQQAKIRFSVEHPDEVNPYESLPEVEMYTFKMSTDKQYQTMDKYFDFAEFFKEEDGKFIHEASINRWLNEISRDDAKTMYPFSTEGYRKSMRHTLWLLPSRAAARALKVLLDKHPVFGEYNVLNIVNDNDNEVSRENDPDMERVRAAISDKPSETKTIILTVRKLTTGVNIPALNAVVFLNNTTSAQNYLQAAFRAQTPFSDEVLGMKKKAYIFDFAPDRALNILAKSVSLSPKAGALNTDKQKEKLGTLLNFLPVLEQSGNEMKPYEVSTMMRQLKKAYAEKAVLAGFDDVSIYNDELWNVTQEDAILFNELQNKIGKTQQSKRTVKIDVNSTGLNEEDRERANRGKRKPKRERTDEENAAIEKEQKLRKEQKSMIDILRGISIRIPLMIYGMDIDLNKDVSLDEFVDLVDQVSWEEFMPKGITKGDFKTFRKFYDPEIFIEAGHRIRQAAVAANNLSHQDRIEKITTIFSRFKNPDKETVLTPWRVVNQQLGLTFGGYNFFDEKFEQLLMDGSYREIDNGEITTSVFSDNAKILEINSKTGLYPLYMAFSIYQRRHNQLSANWPKAEYVKNDKELWKEVLEKNIFVVCKTPMARTITYRTLNGYNENHKVRSNLIYVENLVGKLKEDAGNVAEEIINKFGGGIVKFDAVVGNPPYQAESLGVNNQAKAVYNYFYDLAERIGERYVLISPARFLARQGTTPGSWNEKMLSDEHLKIKYYNPNSNDIFPGIAIKGGVVVLYRDMYKKFGAINTFIPFETLKSIYDKVSKNSIVSIEGLVYSPDSYRFTDIMFEENPALIGRTDSSHAKAVASSVFTRYPEIFFAERPNDDEDYIRIYGRISGERIYRYVKRKYISAPSNLDKWKVFLPGANGTGTFGETISTPVVGGPAVGHSQTFVSIGEFDSEFEAEALLKYIKTKFGRAMLGIMKTTQNNQAKNTWSKIPIQEFRPNIELDWRKSIPEVDEQLYHKYKLKQDEINFIEKKVKTMK